MATQKTCLGVEISQDGLKIAVVEPERKNVIKIDAVPTSGNSINDVSVYASVLNSWARNNLLPKINSVAVAFPSCNGIMRLINVPKETENVSDYVNWELESAINSNINDYQLSVAYYPNAKKPERAIVAAMSKKLIDSFCSAELGKSGFRPSYLMSDIYVLHNLLESSESLGSQPKCVLKADEKFAVAFWGNETGPLAVRLLPRDNISPNTVLNILESGYKELPKAKRNVKFCGELSINTEFTNELVSLAKGLKGSIEIQPWNSLSKFSLERGGNFSKISQCMGVIGATLSCARETDNGAFR
jgi:hypothetical protein